MWNFQGEEEVGVFQDSETAAKARDVAMIVSYGDRITEEELNFPRANYSQSDLEASKDMPTSDLIAALSQHGEARRNSRFLSHSLLLGSCP